MGVLNGYVGDCEILDIMYSNIGRLTVRELGALFRVLVVCMNEEIIPSEINFSYPEFRHFFGYVDSIDHALLFSILQSLNSDYGRGKSRKIHIKGGDD